MILTSLIFYESSFRLGRLVFLDVVSDADNSTTLVFCHLIDQKAGHRSVRVLRNYILDLRSNYLPITVLSGDCFD
jgi:hypothetical protein